MADTPNHEYNVPQQGTQDWHNPLNENFEAFDVDIELRDVESNLGDYTPTDGAKFLATDTGVVYTGNGTTWVPQFVFPEYDPSAGTATVAQTLVTAELDVDTIIGQLTGGTTLSTIAGDNLSIDSNGQLNASTGGGGGGGGISSLSGGDGIDPASIGDGDTLSVAWGDASSLDGSGTVTNWSGAADLDSSGAVDTLSGSVTGGTNLTDLTGNNLSIDSNGRLNASTGGGGGGISNLSGGDGINPGSIGDGDTLSVAWGDGSDLDSDGNVTSQNWTTSNNLLAPSDSSIDGIDVDQVETTTLTVDGTPTLQLSSTGTDSNDNTTGGNVIGGYEDNGVQNGAVGASIGGGGSEGTKQANGNSRRNTNEVTGNYGTISGGQNNRANFLSTVGGGIGNTADGDSATVSGGVQNTASGKETTVGGGIGNTADGYSATVSGGRDNTASDELATVAGGRDNTASGGDATVGGGSGNAASGAESAVAGGGGYVVSTGSGLLIIEGNTASALSSFVGGGSGNTASGELATVAGGGSYIGPFGGVTVGNTASGNRTFIGGGSSNTASGEHATVGGGDGNTASGQDATVPGGAGNVAGGDSSFAAGSAAEAGHKGAFVWADSTDSFSSTGSDQFLVNATGGTGVGTNSPVTTFHVKDSVAGSGGDNLGRHVAAIQNTSTSSSPVPDVLGLELTNVSNPGEFHSYISFMDDSGTIGNIQGDGNGGVEFVGSLADFSEFFPKAAPDQEFESGTLVGLLDGEVVSLAEESKPDAVMVVSTAPLVTGNRPIDEDDRDDYVKLSLVGQVPVRVSESVTAGDVLVASPDNDGSAVARTDCESTGQFVIGMALENCAAGDQARTIVGGPGRDATLADRATVSETTDSETENERLDALEAENDQLREEMAEKDRRIENLEAENDQLRERLSAIEETLAATDSGGTAPASADD